MAMGSKRLFLEVVYVSGGARCSTVVVPGFARPLDLPGFGLYTRQGVVPHLTRDLYESIPLLSALHVPLRSLATQPGTAVLAAHGEAGGTGGLRDFLSLPEHLPLVAGLSDPAFTPPDGFNSDTEVSAFSAAGRRSLTLEQYLGFLRAARPDVAVTLADIQTAHAGRGRHEKAVRRTLEYLDQTLAAETRPAPSLLAPIVGGPFVQLRMLCAEQAAMQPVEGRLIYKEMNEDEL